MAIRVSADTITDITSSADFHGQQGRTSPRATEDLIDKIYHDLRTRHKRIKELEKTPRNLKRLRKAEDEKKLFRKIIKDIPAGFELVPVFYKRITKNENTTIKNKYKEQLPGFFKFLATHRAEELKDLGICEHGIERMRSGQPPADAQNRYYDVSVDHIVETAGAGLWAQKLEVDPLNPTQGRQPVVNHYGNMILMPGEVHKYKNALNDLQRLRKLQPSNQKWTLMLIPERSGSKAGFVSAPQKSQSYRLKFIQDESMARHYTSAVRAVESVGEILEPLKSQDGFKWLVRAYDAICHRPDGKNSSDARNMMDSMTLMVESDPALQKKIQVDLASAAQQAAKDIRKLFNKISRERDTHRARLAFNDFISLYRDGSFGDLRKEAQCIPVAEVKPLTRAFASIDRRIASVAAVFSAKSRPRKIAPPRRKPVVISWQDRKVHHGAGRCSRAAA